MNRFEDFSNRELVVLEAIFSRIGGFHEGDRGVSSRILDEVLLERNKRGQWVRVPQNMVTGSIYFEGKTDV
jgi:hypothetical protein